MIKLLGATRGALTRSVSVGAQTEMDGHGNKHVKECEFDDVKREPFVTVSPIPPWKEIANVTYNTSLTTPMSKKNTVEEQKSAAVKDIEGINADVEIYTDGSAAEALEGPSRSERPMKSLK